MVKNVRKEIVQGIKKGDGWKPIKLTRKQKKALEEGRRMSADSTSPFDLGPNEPLRDQHGNLPDEKITVVMPKAAGITFTMPDELLDKGHADCSICEEGKSQLPHSACPKLKGER